MDTKELKLERHNAVLEEISFKSLCIICLIYAAFYTFCLYRNEMGITFPVFIVGTVGFFVYYMKKMKKEIKKFSLFYIISAILLGINVCVTSNIILIKLDKVFIFVLFFMLFMHNQYDDSTWDLSRYVKALCKNVFSLFGFISYPFYDFSDTCKKKPVENIEKTDDHPDERSNFYYVFIGLCISIPLLFIILPLLLSSDVIFSKKMEALFSFSWNIEAVEIIISIVVVFFAAYAMIYRITLKIGSLTEPVADKRTHNPVIAITVNMVLLVIYMMYSMIQIVYLFLRSGKLPEGYTYARYSHEGFFELVFVCLINIILVLICRKYSRDSKPLKVILCMISGCTYVMIASSAYRMFLYISVYCLTFLRIIVLWALLVMAVIMAGVSVYLFKPDMNIIRFGTVTLVTLWMVFVLINPDYQIAKYNIMYHDDDNYICELSYDAVPAIDKYGNNELLDKFIHSRRYYRNNYIDDETTDFRKINISVLRAAKIAKDNRIL